MKVNLNKMKDQIKQVVGENWDVQKETLTRECIKKAAEFASGIQTKNNGKLVEKFEFYRFHEAKKKTILQEEGELISFPPRYEGNEDDYSKSIVYWVSYDIYKNTTSTRLHSKYETVLKFTGEHLEATLECGTGKDIKVAIQKAMSYILACLKK